MQYYNLGKAAEKIFNNVEHPHLDPTELEAKISLILDMDLVSDLIGAICARAYGGSRDNVVYTFVARIRDEVYKQSSQVFLATLLEAVYDHGEQGEKTTTPDGEEVRAVEYITTDELAELLEDDFWFGANFGDHYKDKVDPLSLAKDLIEFALKIEPECAVPDDFYTGEDSEDEYDPMVAEDEEE